MDFFRENIHWRGNPYDEIYQFAADMGGAGYIFSGENDAEIMHNSSTINLNLLKLQSELNEQTNTNSTRLFYSSSACVYPSYNNSIPETPDCREESVYPAQPDSEYGWEKIFSERLFLAFHRTKHLQVRIARYHNIFGPYSAWIGGKEKAPAAICRKIAQAQDNGEIEIWGDGLQTRSFLYIDECIEATRRFMKNPNFTGPLNIGSEEMVTINELVNITSKVAKRRVNIRYIEGPQGSRARTSSNNLLRQVLQWDYKMRLEEGIEKTYEWIESEVMKSARN
jgi:nucleoside-diphosphate-sugar epimerase